MLKILRNFYVVGTTNIVSAVGAIGTTLQNGDVLLWTTTQQVYGTVVGNAISYAQN